MRSISALLAMSQRLAVSPGISLAIAAKRLVIDVADEHLGAVRRKGAGELAADAGGAGRYQDTLWHKSPLQSDHTALRSTTGPAGSVLPFTHSRSRIS